MATIKASVSFNTATVNFYAKGVKAGQNIKVYQYVNGSWVEVEVTEIRNDHVVVNMTSLGTIAFNLRHFQSAYHYVITRTRIYFCPIHTLSPHSRRFYIIFSILKNQ